MYSNYVQLFDDRDYQKRRRALVDCQVECINHFIQDKKLAQTMSAVNSLQESANVIKQIPSDNPTYDRAQFEIKNTERQIAEIIKRTESLQTANTELIKKLFSAFNEISDFLFIRLREDLDKQTGDDKLSKARKNIQDLKIENKLPDLAKPLEMALKEFDAACLIATSYKVMTREKAMEMLGRRK